MTAQTTEPAGLAEAGRALDGHADVDDVVQDTMLRVVDRLPQLRRPESYRSWPAAITLHQVRDRYRAVNARERREQPDDEGYALADPGADVADLTIL